MNFITPSVELAPQAPGIKGMLKQCELVGRVCYRSEDKITEDSYHKFIAQQKSRHHMSPLEAGTVYLILNISSQHDLIEFFKNNHYSYAVIVDSEAYITTNYRVITENDLEATMIEFWSELTEYHMPRVCFKFETNIAIYKEITRHRSLSPMVESTRFVGYHLQRFSHCVSFTLPCWLGYKSGKPSSEELWLKDKLEFLEKAYFEAQELWGWDPQRASYLLPQGTKATAFFTAFVTDWDWFLKLRYEQITGSVRPDMLELSTKVAEILKQLNYYD